MAFTSCYSVRSNLAALPTLKSPYTDEHYLYTSISPDEKKIFDAWQRNLPKDDPRIPIYQMHPNWYIFYTKADIALFAALCFDGLMSVEDGMDSSGPYILGSTCSKGDDPLGYPEPARFTVESGDIYCDQYHQMIAGKMKQLFNGLRDDEVIVMEYRVES